MTAYDDVVAVVGSPSTNSEISLDMLANSTTLPLVGAMLCVQHQMEDGVEMGLGVVNAITTYNKWHSDPTLQGIVKKRGEIPGMTGDDGDVRAASIKIQACYKKRDDVGHWVQSGPAFRMSPTTGSPVHTVNNAVISELVSGTEELHYFGKMHGTDVDAPFNIPDFSGDEGSLHIAFFGKSGAGKSACAEYMLASQMRHHNLGFIIIDPQGQWSSENKLPFSLQGWAAEMGRDVVVRRISEDLRLEKDAPLFGELLSKTRFFSELMKMSAETKDILGEELVKVVKAIDEWEELDSEEFLNQIVAGLCAPHILRNVYADVSRRERLLVALSELLGQEPVHDAEGQPAVPGQYMMPPQAVMDQRRREVMNAFWPLHNMFSRHNPSGGVRHSLWGTLKSVFDRDNSNPAPLVVLDMSTSAESESSWINDVYDTEEQKEIREALKILNNDIIKASILRRTCLTLKNASEDAFRDGKTLNTMVVMDEAWRFAAPPAKTTEPELKELSIDLAGYARDTRKFGIGWCYITQSPKALNSDIWDQLSIRFIGHGLAGSELSKVGETLDTADHLNLYRGFAPPKATIPRVWPFMVTGPVSPLSFTQAPLFIAAPDNFDAFRAVNNNWIEPIRLAMGQPVRTGPPVPPNRTTPPSKRVSTRTKTRPNEADVQRVKQFASTGGVNPSQGVGLSTDPTFSSSLDSVDSNELPF